MRSLIPALPTNPIPFFPPYILPTTKFTTKFTDSNSHSSLANNSPRGNFCQRLLQITGFRSDRNSIEKSIAGSSIDPDPSQLNSPTNTMGVFPDRINGGSNNGEKMTLIFTYGTLKRGFSNHVLMQELIEAKDAVFVGACRTAERLPLVCGPYRVPFLLNKPGAGERVCGELYAVTRKGLVRMDELEGTSRGHYERLPIKVVAEEGEEAADVEAEAYFGHRSYAEEMWRRSGERGYAIYSEKEARGYVKRKDRPVNLTFLDHIRIFLTSPS